MTNHFFECANATYAYNIVGEGEALLLLHGFTGSKDTWSPVAARLSAHFTVITMDLPGHGKTKCDMPKTMETFADDLASLLDHLQIKTCHVLGYSMGGRTALSFAMYYPDYVDTLILESASAGLQTEEERALRIAHDTKLANRLLVDGVQAFVDFWESIPLFDTQKRLPQETREKIRKERLSQSKTGLSNSLLHMGTGVQPCWWDTLHKLTMPVLLLAGGEDQKFVKLNKKMLAQLKHATLMMVEGAGHTIHVEQAEEFVKIVIAFIKKNT